LEIFPILRQLAEIFDPKTPSKKQKRQKNQKNAKKIRIYFLISPPILHTNPPPPHQYTSIFRMAMKDFSFVPDLGDTGTISSMHFGQLGNQTILATANFNTGMDLIAVEPSGRTQNNTQAFQSRRMDTKATETPTVCVQIDSINRVVYGATCDGSIQAWLPERNQMVKMGAHNDICSHIRLSPQNSILISSGYDGMIRYWDVRTHQEQAQVNCGAKITAMDYNDNLIVATLEGNKVALLDIRNPTRIVSTSPSQLSDDLVGIVAMHKDEGYIISSLDARGRVEFVRDSSKGFTFRGHRVEGQQTEAYAFPVMTCHPEYNTLVTAGYDGTWITWDFYEKQKVTSSVRFNNPITAAAFSPDGKMLAFASSYNWYRGANGDPAKTRPNDPSFQSKIGFLLCKFQI